MVLRFATLSAIRSCPVARAGCHVAVGRFLPRLAGRRRQGRALGVGEVKFTGGARNRQKVTYRINFKRVITRKLIMGVADGEVLVDGEVIYTATDLKVVGLFKGTAARSTITLTRRRPPPSFPTIAYAVVSRGGISSLAFQAPSPLIARYRNVFSLLSLTILT